MVGSIADPDIGLQPVTGARHYARVAVLSLRRRHSPRILPALVAPSRTRMAALVLAAVVVVGAVFAAVASREAEGLVELDPSGPVTLVSTAGPVAIGSGPVAELRYRASWLLRGPNLPARSGPAPVRDVSLGCDTSWPCRASARVELAGPTELTVRAESGPVLVEAFAGTLAVSTVGDHDVILGPVDGEVSVETDQGDVDGHGLAAIEVEIATSGGRVRLGFRERPRTVRVTAGTAPVVVELPPGRYAVSVGGSPSATVDVDQDDTADSRILVDGRGPVRITTTT